MITDRAMRFGFFETGFAWDQFLALIEAIPDCVIAIDTSGRIATINSEAEACLGYTRETLIGQAVEILLPHALRSEHRRMREEYARHPHPRPMGAGRDLTARCADGTELPVDISLSPLLVAEQKVVIAVLRDISERRTAEAQIRKLNAELDLRVRQRTAELEAANRRLEEYAYAVSHELRSPLRIVRGFVDLLQQDLGSDPLVHNHVSHIVDGAQRMTRIIDGLLSLARLEHHELKCTIVDMTDLTNQVVREIREDSNAHHVDFNVAPLPPAKGDAVLLHQVMINLLSNAVKYCGDRTTTAISVRGQIDGKRIIYQVQDNGPGFDGNQATTIFDPFRRLAETDSMEGLGIGLALARRIIERHGGLIWAESTPGGGATFSFFLSQESASQAQQ